MRLALNAVTPFTVMFLKDEDSVSHELKRPRRYQWKQMSSGNKATCADRLA